MAARPTPGYARAMRDDATKLVEANIRGVLAETGVTRADVQRTMNGSSAIYDFLSEKSRVRSITVETLAKFARAVGVPLILFFVEPDKRVALHRLLGRLDSLEPQTLDQLAEIAKALDRPRA